MNRREAFIVWFITFQQYVGTGRGLFSWFTEPLKLVLVGGAFVFPSWVASNILLSIFGVFFFYLALPYGLGWWWDSRGYFHKQAAWGNARNEEMMRLARIEKLLLDFALVERK